MRDEQNKNRQTEEDRFIEAYLNRIDAEAPDLWDRIEAGLDREAKDVEEKQKKTSKVKYVIPVLAIAAVLLAAVIATPLLSDSKRHSKEINAGRTTDVSNDGLDAAENSNISDRAEDYVDETADSIPETVQNETANRPTQNTTEVPAFIITMAMMNIASGIAYVYTGGQSTRITNKLFIEIGTGYLFNVIPLPVVYMVVLIILFSFILSKTKFGTYVYAIGGNREAARLSGVPIKKIEIIVFTISGLLSAFAGLVLCSRMYSGQPSVGSGYELDAIAACVLGGTSMTGGKGRISGTVFGAMVIGIISNGLNLIGVSSYWQLIIKGLIIACAVLLDGQKGKLELLKKKKLAAN